MKKSLLLFSFLTFKMLCFAQDPIVSLTKSDFHSPTVTCNVADFSYSATEYCKNSLETPIPIFNSNSTAGIFSSVPSGLNLNSITGEISLAVSPSGLYIVTNTIAAANGCPEVNFSLIITITEPASGSFTYNTPLYISTLAPQIPTASVTTGGFYSSGPGLVIDAITGAINSSASTAGDYTVSYDVAANAGCDAFNANFMVTVLLTLNTSHFSDFSVQLFPNPTNSKIYIKTSNKITFDKIIVTDFLGKIVATQTINTTEINVEQLAAGLYFIEGFFGNQKFQSKFIRK